MKEQPKYKPRVVEVQRSSQSAEDEAPTMPLSMASPAPAHAPPAVIILRPSWLDLPARRLLNRLTLVGACSIPIAIIITITIHITWRLS